MDPNDTQAAPGAEAEPTLSPSVTDGESSSDSASDAQETAADAMRASFLETYGEGESEETDEPTDGDEPDPDDAGESGEAGDGQDPEAAAVSDAQTPEEEETPATDEGADDDKFRIPHEEFKALPDGVKKRLGHLNTRAKKAERENAQLTEQIAPLKDAHERFTQLQNFVSENDIQSENVTLGFNAMAALSKGDHQGFLDMVMPWVSHAQESLGLTISADLQQRVDDGYLTEEDAKAMTRAQAKAKTAEAERDRLQKRSDTRSEQDAAADLAERVTKAISECEAKLKSSDPDYAQKSRAIASMVDLAMSSGALIKSPEDAVKLIEDAHKRVTEQMAPPTPSPKPTPPRPNATGSSRATPEPKTASDALFHGLRDAQD